MKILVVNNMAPFIWGGAEELAVNLQKNLLLAGHEAEILRIPFQWEPAVCIPSQMMMVRSFELDYVDKVIALKFPAYLIRHPNKTLWVLHQFRQAYDLYDEGLSNLIGDQYGKDIKAFIQAADNQAFNESRNIFTLSEVTQNRLKKYNNCDSQILVQPAIDPEQFTGGEAKGYIFAGGRINTMKRQYLLLEALKQTHKKVKLIIAGPPDTINEADKLKENVEKYGLADRVKLDLRFLAKSEYVDYINHSNAVAYLPFDEDSLSYVAMESATAGKPLITTTDSGGVLKLVKHEETGWITDPAPEALSHAMNAVFDNNRTVKKYGEAARTLWYSLGITWEKTIERLLK